MSRALPIFFLVVAAATVAQTSGLCSELKNDVHLELHLFPACRLSKNNVQTVFDVAESFAASARVSVSLTPVTCGFDQHAECILLQNGNRFRRSAGAYSIRGWGDAALCLQASQPGVPSTDTVRLLRCLATNATTARKLNACGYLYGNWQEGQSANENLRNCVSAHRAAVDRAWARAEQSGVTTDPTLFINGRIYCGSFSLEDLTAAVCAASATFPTTAFSSSSKTCRVWWNATEGGADDSGSCSVKTSRSPGRFMEALAIICFVMVSSTFLFMVLSRRRLDAMLSQQRRREASGHRLHELLSILATTRNASPRRPSGEVDEAIRALTIKRYSVKPSESGDGASGGGGVGSTCTICLEPMVEGDEFYELEDCDHVYHKDCLKVWLQKKNECPICRRSILDLPEPSPTNDVGIELRNVSRNSQPGVERVINFTTANGANVTISLSTNSQVALSMT